MVDALCRTGRVRSAPVEQAFRAVPRHRFVPDVPVDAAYADEAVSVQHVDGMSTSSASQPSMMAIMLEQLDLRPGQSVLEIGAGTGYNAALMARIVGPTGRVTAVDIDEELIAGAATHLDAAGTSGVDLVCGDGALGHPPGAPYDRIVLTVGCGDVRPEWAAQLAPGGRLLLPLAVRGSQLSAALDLGPDGLLRSDSIRGCSFIRLRGLAAPVDAVVRLGDGATLHLPEDRPLRPDADVVTAVLGAPGRTCAVPAELGPLDIWDGFGLWLALTDPGAVRLLREGDDDRPGLSMFPIGSGSGSVALLEPATGDGAPTAPGPGLAIVCPDREGRVEVDGWPRAARVHAFGPAGDAVAERMRAAVAAWDLAGRPRAAGLHLLVAPRGRQVEGPAEAALVQTPSAAVTAYWTAPSGPPPG